MAFAWKTNGLPTAWRRIAEAKMSPRPVSMNNARAPCQYQRPNSSPKIGITVSFYLSSSGGSSRRDASKGAGAWRGGRGGTKREGRDAEGRRYQCRRGEIGRKMGNPATWWQMVDHRWGEACASVWRVARGRGRPSGVNIPRSLGGLELGERESLDNVLLRIFIRIFREFWSVSCLVIKCIICSLKLLVIVEISSVYFLSFFFFDQGN